MTTEKRRVVVTGMGVVTAVGLDERTFWANMLAGRCGIRRLLSLDVAACRTTVGAEVDDAQLAGALEARQIAPSDRTVDFALLAAAQALEQAGIARGGPPYAETDAATIFGTGAGCSHSLSETYAGFAQKGVRGVRPTAVPRCMANAVSAQLSMRFRLTGPNYVVVCACTSATTAIGTAFRLVRDGYAETVLCGGADAVFEPTTFAAWNNLGVMSRNADPLRACRPFDADRDGCVLGEGAGALVVESLERARGRGAPIRAEICGFGETSDADHITRPSVSGQARAIRAALDSAGMAPGDIGFINAHGTATRANDVCESRSIREALRDDAGRVPAASNKSLFGHLLGASGAAETIATILGLESGKVPPNLNLDRPDPECAIRLVGAAPLEVASPVAMKNSFGFGGNNAVLILRRWE
jgi:3-oxoacyl-[acyl-carrier-protein] synthase II